MKKHLLKVLSFTAIIIFISGFSVYGQTEQTEKADQQIDKVISDAGAHFKAGLTALQDNLRSKAGENFDKSVEVFLLSTMDVQKNEKLNVCYTQLIETVYLIEFPFDKQPDITMLSNTCGWNLDNKLINDVAKNIKNFQNENKAVNTNTTASVSNNISQTNNLVGGFNTQTFEASPLDDLAKLELTQEEQQVENNPVAQQQYQYIAYAVSNKSLGFSFQVHPMIQQYLNYYQGRGRGTMETGLYRSGMFMRMARRIFREEGVPENVAWLGQVESMWKPTAMSWAAASGLWQFIPGTGTRFGLKRTAYIDERNSFESATRASAKYLKFLANRYGGNWELAMAAYNSGEGNVDRAIARAGVANFWIAYPYLPKETRNYVPNILATILIANNPQQYGFGQVRPAPQLMYDQIRVPASVNLSLVAQASDTTVEYLRYLNPELRTNMTPPEPYIIRVPAGKANEVVAIFKRVNPNDRNTAGISNASRGETWQTISNRTGVSVQDLMAANGNAAIPGGKVVIPKGNGVTTTNYSRPTTPLPTMVSNPVRVVKAQNGDTVATVAQRYGASAVEVAKFNGLLPNAKLPAGREIRIPTANK